MYTHHELAPINYEPYTLNINQVRGALLRLLTALIRAASLPLQVPLAPFALHWPFLSLLPVRSFIPLSRSVPSFLSLLLSLSLSFSLSLGIYLVSSPSWYKPARFSRVRPS